jgi:hypothetical protein
MCLGGLLVLSDDLDDRLPQVEGQGLDAPREIERKIIDDAAVDLSQDVLHDPARKLPPLVVRAATERRDEDAFDGDR